MSTVATIRGELAATLTAELGDKAVVYAYPAETVALPAVVLVPDDPYWEPATFRPGDEVVGVRVNIEIQVVIPRTELETAFDTIEQLLSDVILATSKVPVVRWVDAGKPEAVRVEEIDAMSAPVSIAVIL